MKGQTKTVAAVCHESVCLIPTRSTADLTIYVSRLAEISGGESTHPLIGLFKTGKIVLVEHSRRTSHTFRYGSRRPESKT